MLFRLIISTVLIVMGVASPWLVRDWLEWQAYHKAHKDLAPSGVSFASSTSKPDGSTGYAERSYPLASQAMKVVQGLVPRTISATATPALSFFQKNTPPENVRSKGVVAGTSPQLKKSLAKMNMKIGDPVFIRVFKETKELEVWILPEGKQDYALYKVYRVSHWSGNPGPKVREGDGQCPEGFYYVTSSRLRPGTKYHLGLELGFPNAFDTYHSRTGSDLLIHGEGRSVGSFSLVNANMNEVYTLAEGALKGGQKFFRVNIFPFRMTDKRMDKEWAGQPKWIKFWVNLKEGYDFFENANFPPDVDVEAGNYVFSAR